MTEAEATHHGDADAADAEGGLDSLSVSVDGPIVEIVLDRPKANAIDASVSRDMGALFAAFRDNPQLRAAILTGAGERFFCAGWDLMAAAAGEDFEADYGVGGFGGFGELWDLRKPVICAVNGMAVGGGFEIVLGADFVVAVDHAEFWLPETSLGMVADTASVRLPRLLPPALANEVLLAGRRLSAHEMLRWGLVNAVVDPRELMSEARALAEKISQVPPLSLAATIEIRDRTRHLAPPDAFALIRSGQLRDYQAMLASSDSVAGARSFADSRTPRGHHR